MSAVPARADLERILDVYRRLQVHHAHLVHQQGAEVGLNQTDLRFLFFLDAAATDGILPKDATLYLGLSTGATTSLVDRLEIRGLVARVPNPADRRSVFVRISDEGRTTVSTVRQLYLDAFAEAIPRDRVDEFTTLLAAFDAAVVARTTGANPTD